MEAGTAEAIRRLADALEMKGAIIKLPQDWEYSGVWYGSNSVG
jgi:hypothetical protein